MGRPRKYSDELRRRRYLDATELSALTACYESGATVYELADQFGIHRDRVSRLLEDAGVPRRYHQTVDVDLDRATLLHIQGFALQQIADQLGIGRTALVVARRRALVSQRSVQGQANQSERFRT
jgi:DNA-binding transcriptional regulator LsrR (DeoR family)